MATENKPTLKNNPQIKESCEALIILLVEKAGEDQEKEFLLKDIDVIRNNLSKN
jgi:hypothetical protein